MQLLIAEVNHDYEEDPESGHGRAEEDDFGEEGNLLELEVVVGLN